MHEHDKISLMVRYVRSEARYDSSAKLLRLAICLRVVSSCGEALDSTVATNRFKDLADNLRTVACKQSGWIP